MCGRYASSRPKDELAGLFDVPAQGVTDRTLPPDWNVAPTKDVYVVLDRRPRGGDGGTADASGLATREAGARPPAAPVTPLRRLWVCRWGLVPSWAKDPAVGSRMINARAETLAEKPAFRRAFAARRCLVPADGFYEWYAPEASSDRPAPRKQPFFLHDREGQVLAMAGLYEFWRPADADPQDADAWLVSCTVITTQATDELGHIHDRMPMVIPADRWDRWLDPDLREPGEVARLLVPAADRVVAYPVATTVNDVRSNGPELVQPLPAQDRQPAPTSPDEPTGRAAGSSGEPAGLW